MDVIALDQAGIGEAVAPLGTALTEGQLGLLWRLSPCAHPLLRRRRGRAEGGGARGACGRCPMSGPAARSASSPCRPARTPTISSAPSGRGALRRPARAARAAGRPAVAPRARRRAADHAGAAAPGSGAGCCDHVAAIQDADVREQYRVRAAQPLQRADPAAAPALDTPQRPGRAAASRPAAPDFGRGQGARPAPASARSSARAVLHGLIRFPALIGQPCRGDRRACRSPSRRPPGCATLLLECGDDARRA